MAILNSCVCCSIKHGSIVLAVLMILGSLCSIYSNIHNIIGNNPQDVELLANQLGLYRDQVEDFSNASRYANFVILALNVLTLVFCSLLICGTLGNGTSYMIKPTLIYMPIEFLIRIVCLCVICGLARIGILHTLVLMNFVVYLIVMALQVAIWICFYSYYQQLTQGGDKVKESIPV